MGLLFVRIVFVLLIGLFASRISDMRAASRHARCMCRGPGEVHGHRSMGVGFSDVGNDQLPKALEMVELGLELPLEGPRLTVAT